MQEYSRCFGERERSKEVGGENDSVLFEKKGYSMEL